jgi:hypothetical protein
VTHRYGGLAQERPDHGQSEQQDEDEAPEPRSDVFPQVFATPSFRSTRSISPSSLRWANLGRRTRRLAHLERQCDVASGAGELRNPEVPDAFGHRTPLFSHAANHSTPHGAACFPNGRADVQRDGHRRKLCRCLHPRPSGGFNAIQQDHAAWLVQSEGRAVASLGEMKGRLEGSARPGPCASGQTRDHHQHDREASPKLVRSPRLHFDDTSRGSPEVPWGVPLSSRPSPHKTRYPGHLPKVSGFRFCHA